MASMDMVRIGHRLRQARVAAGWTLHDVDAHTDGEFKASALSAYERGERALSVPRIMRLSEIYGVSIDNIFGVGTEIDLTALHVEEDLERTEPWAEAPVLAAMARFSAYIRSVRRVPMREPVGVRRSDSEFLAILFGTDSASVDRMLESLGLATVRSAPTTGRPTTGPDRVQDVSETAL